MGSERAPGDGDDDPAGGAEARVGARMFEAVTEMLDGGIHAHLRQHHQRLLLAVPEAA